MTSRTERTEETIGQAHAVLRQAGIPFTARTESGNELAYTLPARLQLLANRYREGCKVLRRVASAETVAEFTEASEACREYLRDIPPAPAMLRETAAQQLRDCLRDLAALSPPVARRLDTLGNLIDSLATPAPEGFRHYEPSILEPLAVAWRTVDADGVPPFDDLPGARVLCYAPSNDGPEFFDLPVADFHPLTGTARRVTHWSLPPFPGLPAPEPEETTWQERLQSERDELAGRLVKLRAFLNQPQPAHVTNDDYLLLRQQAGLMQDLLEILETRLQRANSTT